MGCGSGRRILFRQYDFATEAMRGTGLLVARCDAIAEGLGHGHIEDLFFRGGDLRIGVEGLQLYLESIV